MNEKQGDDVRNNLLLPIKVKDIVNLDLEMAFDCNNNVKRKFSWKKKTME